MQSTYSRMFVVGLLGLLAVSMLATAAIYWRIYGYSKLFGDFDTFRAAALHIKAYSLSAVYPIAEVKSLFAAHNLKDFAFFLNPPTGLFIVYPLAYFDRLPGLVFWSLGQLMLLWIVLRMSYFKRLFASGEPEAVPTQTLLAVVFSAFCLQNLLYGQLAIFCSVLFLLVFTLRKTHPYITGILLGVFSFKPQLGILLPLLLLVEGNAKALCVAIFTAFAMALFSYMLWGGLLWQDYGAMLAVRSRFMAEDPDLLFVLSTSVYAGVRNLGTSTTTALIVQGGVAVLALIRIWPILRKGREIQKISLLILATYLVTPYSLVYDMPLLAIPCALLLRRAEINTASLSELIALLFLILMPLVTVLLQIGHIPYSIIAVGFTFIIAGKRLASELNHAHG